MFRLASLLHIVLYYIPRSKKKRKKIFAECGRPAVCLAIAHVHYSHFRFALDGTLRASCPHQQDQLYSLAMLLIESVVVQCYGASFSCLA